MSNEYFPSVIEAEFFLTDLPKPNNWWFSRTVSSIGGKGILFLVLRSGPDNALVQFFPASYEEEDFVIATLEEVNANNPAKNDTFIAYTIEPTSAVTDYLQNELDPWTQTLIGPGTGSPIVLPPENEEEGPTCPPCPACPPCAVTPVMPVTPVTPVMPVTPVTPVILPGPMQPIRIPEDYTNTSEEVLDEYRYRDTFLAYDTRGRELRLEVMGYGPTRQRTWMDHITGTFYVQDSQGNFIPTSIPPGCEW